jgi:CelD/BcsL family acetyltransferase involved in cellulose biosynthesis
MLRVECVNPLDLTKGDVVAWRRMILNQPVLSSPYLTPDWAQAVARRRNDAQVAIFRDGERAVGFLPVQRPGANVAMPIGSPVCDYQALIGPAGATFDLAQATAALNVGRIDLTAGIRGTAVESHLQTTDVGHVVRFEHGFDAWAAERQAAGSKTVARARKKFSKLKRDMAGDVRIEAFSTDAAAFDQLVAWKREQMQTTGVTDIFAHAWIAGLVRDIFEAPANTSFGGAMFVLRVKGKPAAVLFCLQARASLHAWFVAHDDALAEYSPGQILFIEAIKAAAEEGFTEMDLGPGDYRFKASLANAVRPIGAGYIGRPSVATACKAAQYRVRSVVESLPVGRARAWPAKAMRRLEIANGLHAPA